jgi:hypothetical protein
VARELSPFAFGALEAACHLSTVYTFRTPIASRAPFNLVPQSIPCAKHGVADAPLIEFVDFHVHAEFDQHSGLDAGGNSSGPLVAVTNREGPARRA